MAQPVKIGLDYFPLNVDIFDDEKVMAISKEFGIKGEVAVIRLLCAIYRNGYFIEWSDALRNKLQMNMPGVSSELLDTIVMRLVRWDFFDKSLFCSTGILTSRGIQKRYLLAVKRRKAPANMPYLIVRGGDDKKVSVIDKPRDKATATATPTTPTDTDRQETTWFEEHLNDQLFVETAAMRFHVSIDEIKRGLENFHLENKAKGKRHADRADYRSHAFDWLRYWVQDNKPKNDDNNRKERKNQRRGTEISATKAEDYTTTF